MDQQTRTIELELGQRKAGERTFSAVISTESPVRLRTIVTATKWQPVEASAVAVGADAGAEFGRSQNMGHEDTATTTDTDTRDAATIERERCAEITRYAGALGVEGDDLIREGTDIAEARKRLLERHVENERSVPTPSAGGRASLDNLTGARQTRAEGWMGRRIEAGPDDGAEFRAAATDAVLMRAGVHVEEPHAAAKDVSPSLARTCLSRAGRTVSGGTEALIRGSMTTSDFPLILADAIHKSARRGYEDEPASHRAWVRPQPVSDFRLQRRPILGSAPQLEQVGEGAEYTHGPMGEDSASYRVQKFGRIVSLTWETLVNDDIGAFVRVQPAMGQAARRAEADNVYAVLTDNPTMQDGQVLFHADQGNLAGAGGVDAATLGAARTLLRRQTAVGGGFLSLVPRFIICAPAQETDFDLLLQSATRHLSQTMEAETPAWLGNLELVVEPRLPDGDSFYLAADSGQIDTIELGLLQENGDGPMIEQEEEFNRDVYRWRVRHVFGAAPLDWRGLVRVPLS